MKTNWPILNFDELKDTIATVQLWTQIVGKIRLCKMPWINHSWHVTLYVSPTGLTTAAIPYEDGIFQIDFDFVQHKLWITTSSGENSSLDLTQRTVANFYGELMQKLGGLGIDTNIYPKPNELDLAIPFEKDEIHHTYNPAQMNNLWQAWINIHIIFTKFRAKFRGKCSPVHFFWGAFDLAVTRFSGREAPLHPGGAPNMPLSVMQEAYSHEVSSCGFWPGSEASPYPVFYAYCYPTPVSFGEQPVKPAEAFFSEEMGEFFLPYADVIKADDPENYLMEFLQSTYEAAANTGHWQRDLLECDFSVLERKH
ncbi:MAG TPA: DUF5996 family protein [Mucilaginibacter sp.]|jgi:hypothetical protein